MEPRRDRDEHPSSDRGEKEQLPVLLWLVAGLFTIALLWLLRAAAALFLPLAIAFFLAIAVLPIANAVRARVPTWLGWLGHVAASGIVIAFLLLFFIGIGIAAQQVASNAGEIIPQIQNRVSQLPFAESFRDSLPQLVQRARTYAASLAAGLGSTLGSMVVVFFLMLLMLLEAGDWRQKVDSATSVATGKEWRSIAVSVGDKFRRYFLTRLVLGGITGAAYALWLALFGVPLLLVWAILALLLNFIPTIGSLIAGALPVLFVFAQRDPGTAMVIGAGILVIEQIMGNYVDPRITGRQLSVSPLVVLASLLLWAGLWGIPGALIATPMTMLIVIVLAQFEGTRPIALMLSNETGLEALDDAIQPR